MKTCTKCNQTKELSEFYKDKAKKDGLEPSCKECRSMKNKKYAAKNHDMMRIKRKQYHEQNREKLNQACRDWRASNPEVQKAADKKWYEANKEKKAASSKVWRETSKEWLNDYRQKNKERNRVKNQEYYRANKNKIQERHKEWDLKNPDKKNAHAAKRRAAKLQRTPSWLTPEDWDRIDAFYTEAQRLSKETGIKHEVDHIIPLQGKNISGFHHPDNLQILTASENRSKGNRV